ncbi:MAG: hypothetical protein IBX69_11475, partial [Anaerolineales bacterium]|nr:hypothetical protein [Anaerolineales bacterium]
MSITHRTAFKLIEKVSSGEIKDWEQAELDQHLEGCQQCRADASLFQELGKVDWQEFSELQPTNQQLVADLHQKLPIRKRKQNLLRFANGFAWAGLAILFVLGLNWTFGTLIPVDEPLGVVPGIVEPGLSSPQPGSDARGEIRSMPGLLDDHKFTYPILLLGFFSIVGVALGFWRKRIWAKWGWLGLLLMGLLILIMFHTEVAFSPNAVPRFMAYLTSDGLYITVMLIVSSLIIHFVINPEVRKRQLLYFLIPYSWLLCIFLTIPSFMSEVIHAPSNFMQPSAADFSGLWLFLIGGAILGSFWLAWELPGKWRWTLYLFLFLMFSSVPLMLAMDYLPQNAISFLNYFPPLLQFILMIAYLLFWSFSAIFTARILKSILSGGKKQGIWRMLLKVTMILVTFVFVFTMVFEINISDMTSYDPGFWNYTFFFMVATGSALALIGISWEMAGWRKNIALSLMIVFVLGIIPALIIPRLYSEVLHVRRAEAVNQAILDYHVVNNRYPEDLDD